MGSQELISRNIRRLRTAYGVSQTRLADMAGIDRTYISRLERMTENPSVRILDKISHALGVATAELFTPVGQQTPQLPPPKVGRPRKASLLPR